VEISLDNYIKPVNDLPPLVVVPSYIPPTHCL